MISDIAAQDQPAGAERHHRGGAGRRGRQGLRRGRQRGEAAGHPDRALHRGDHPPHRRGARRHRRLGRRGGATSSTTIGEIDAIAGSIAAAVEQQGAATAEIARNVTETAAAANEMTGAHRRGLARGRARPPPRRYRFGRDPGAERCRSVICGRLWSAPCEPPTAEVDRRRSATDGRRLPCQIEISGRGGVSARLSDLSEAGARVTGASGLMQGTAGKLRITGLSVPLKFRCERRGWRGGSFGCSTRTNGTACRAQFTFGGCTEARRMMGPENAVLRVTPDPNFRSLERRVPAGSSRRKARPPGRRAGRRCSATSAPARSPRRGRRRYASQQDRSPRLIRPSRHASHSARGTEAADVLACRSTVTTTRSLARPSLRPMASMMRWLA